jgi:sugar diacid utilization regulator
MEATRLLRLLPNMPCLVEAFLEAGWECRAQIQDTRQNYRSIRLYHGQRELQPDVLYLLRPTETGFPTDHFSYICAEPIKGDANHFICPGQPDEQILDFILELFSRYQQWEQMIDQLIFSKDGLQELCQIGARLLENPVCIHDDWFMMIAMSQDLAQTMAPEYFSSSTKGFIPRMILDDFQHDSDYLETYAHRNAQVWKNGAENQESLYVNLWDGAVYKGRLLVLRSNRPFKHIDFILAEVLTQRAVFLLRQQYLGEQKNLRSMDDVVYSLVQGRQMESSELTQLLNMLNWKKNDRFLCIRVRAQQNEGKTVMEHVLHSDLFRIFPAGYILFSGAEQCVILNLNRESLSGAMIHHRLAPLCRDYCLYAGISSPVTDIHDLHLAYYQAQVAIDQAFRLCSEKWIIHFAECAMEHMLENLNSPLPTWCLVSPELLTVMDHDRQKGTQYFETFREYLLNERDIPKTSEKLIIHRTTLLYRLKKIQSMLNVNLEDPWQRLYLTLSLWILENQKNQ